MEQERHTEGLGGDTGTGTNTGTAKEPFNLIAKLSPKERHIVAKMVEEAYEKGLNAARTQPADRQIRDPGKTFAQKEWAWLYQGLNAGNTPFSETQSYGGSVESRR